MRCLYYTNVLDIQILNFYKRIGFINSKKKLVFPMCMYLFDMDTYIQEYITR